jgi:excisionase family DNA binding protein
MQQPLTLADLPELASLSQAAAVLGLSVNQVRGLIQTRRIEHVMIGRRPFIPKPAIPRFIADNTVKPCHEETPAPAFASSKDGPAFTFAGPKEAAAGSAARHVRSPAS